MRQIKFRAWDGKNMFYDVTQWYVSDKDKKYHLCDGHKLQTLMQFTGLKDKNEKEIYEGDIVKRGKGDYNQPNNKGYLSVIEWRDKGFWVKDEGFGWEGELLWDWSKIEVIGNIHENPDLLK